VTVVDLEPDSGQDRQRERTGTAYPDNANADLLSRIPLDARTILDVGCGTGALGAAYRGLNSAARLLGIERDPEMAAIARQRLDAVACVDVQQHTLPFELPDGIDCLIYGDVLQQLRDPWTVLRRQLEPLNPGGSVLVCVANAEHWSMVARLLRGNWQYEPAGLFDVRHLRWFSLRNVMRELADAGLAVEEVHPRIFAPEQAQQFVQTFAPGLQRLGIDPGGYLPRAMPLQYVFRACRAGSQTTTASAASATDQSEDAILEKEALIEIEADSPPPLAGGGWGEGVDRKPDDEPPLSKLLMNFESLGDNCEFGLVQRQAGAEPLGLLRFASPYVPIEVRLRTVVDAIERRFEGLGSPDTVHLKLEGKPERREYLVHESAYQLLHHTFIHEGEVDPDEFRRKEARRLVFLRDKLLADLAAGEKLWVWKSNLPLSYDDIRPLMDALRRLGPNSLLWVVVADPEHPPGTVERIESDLLKGYVDRFAAYNDATNVSFESWYAVSRAAYGLWHDRGSGDETDAIVVPGASTRSLTIKDLAPLIESADAEQWSAAGLQAADLFANGGRYLRREARLLSSSPDIQANHQKRYGSQVEEYPPIYRAVFRDATTTGEGTLILRDSSLINDSCWEVFAQGGVPTGLQRLPNGDLVRAANPSRRIETPSLLLKRPYGGNYGHWLVDSAAILALIGALSLPRELQIVVGASGDNRMRNIIREALGILAPAFPVVEHPDNETWEFAELHYVMPLSKTPLFKLPQALAALRSLILASSQPRSHGRKIFIDRGREWRRSIENEAELRDACREVGFEFVKPENLSLRAQAELFNEARVIVGMKGAALTNLLFCASSASVIVLSPHSWVDAFFWDIAGQIGLKYIEILGPAEDNAKGPGEASFRIDRNLFAQALAETCGPRTEDTPTSVITNPALSDATNDFTTEAKPSHGPHAPIVAKDTPFVSRSLLSMTETVGLERLRDVPFSRAVLSPAGTIEMPCCYVMNSPSAPLSLSDTPHHRIFPRQMRCPEMWVARLDDVYYLPYGAPFLPDQGILINDFLVPWGPNAIGWFKFEGEGTYKLPMEIDLTAANYIDTAFFMGHPISGDFGHFIGDCLSRLHAWQDCRKLFGQVKIIVDHAPEDTGFRERFLTGMDVSPEDIVFAQGLVRCRKLLSASTALGISRYASPTSAKLWPQVRDALADSRIQRNERIYFSRSTKSAQKLRNETEVENLFRSFGFSVLCPEDLPIEEQVSLVSNAQLVAGPAGSTMFNLAFQRHLKSVLILLPETSVHNSEWLFLAGAKCPVYYHFGPRDMPAGSQVSGADAWRVDMSQLASDVASWLWGV